MRRIGSGEGSDDGLEVFSVPVNQILPGGVFEIGDAQELLGCPILFQCF